MPVRFDLRGRVVLITGAARGIGAEAARQLAARGARLSLVGIEPDELSRRAEELKPAAMWFEADVTDSDRLEAAVAATRERFGAIDVVIANAGIAPPGMIATIDEAVFERTIHVNLLGVWRTVRATLPYVTERQGYVLAIASIAAALPTPLMSHYAASKAGVEAFARSLRAEIAHTGTSVGIAYFSFVDTDMVRDALGHPEAATLLRYAKGRWPWAAVTRTSVAARAIVCGIERRARQVYAPPWVPLVLYARGLLAGVVEHWACRAVARHAAS